MLDLYESNYQSAPPPRRKVISVSEERALVPYKLPAVVEYVYDEPAMQASECSPPVLTPRFANLGPDKPLILMPQYELSIPSIQPAVVEYLSGAESNPLIAREVATIATPTLPPVAESAYD